MDGFDRIDATSTDGMDNEHVSLPAEGAIGRRIDNLPDISPYDEPVSVDANSAYDDAPMSYPAYEDDQPLTSQDEPLASEEQPREKPGKLARKSKKTGPSAGQQIMAGFTAVRDVRAAAKQHAEAKAQMKSLKAQLADDRKALDHRLSIEADYDSIVATQTAELADAREVQAEAAQRISALQAEVEATSSELVALRAEHEEQLRPYKNLMETTKGRADDTALELADARRALKSAEAQLNDAAKRRDQSIASKNRAVDNATERLRRVQSELDRLSKDSDASPTALPKVRDEVAAERARLDAARADVEKATADGKQMVENAQASVWSHKQALEAIEDQAADAKSEAAAAREEYDALYKDAKAAEDKLDAVIKDRTRQITEAESERDAAQARIDTASALLDEANEIHGTPEITAQMSAHVQEEQAELEQQQVTVRELARSEKQIRSKTRKNRIMFFAAIAGLVLVIALVVWFFFLRPMFNKPSTTTQDKPAATATATQGQDDKTKAESDKSNTEDSTKQDSTTSSSTSSTSTTSTTNTTSSTPTSDSSDATSDTGSDTSSQDATQTSDDTESTDSTSTTTGQSIAG